jgi:hypothetical protein
MSAERSSLTAEEVAQIEGLINSSKDKLISSIVAAVEKRQAEIADTAKTEIDQAVAKNQRIVLATVQGGTEKATSKNGAKLWEFVKVVFPVVATALLGFWVWKWQANIQTKISDEAEKLKTELAIKQDVNKRKLDLYEQVVTQMVELEGKIRAAEYNEDVKKQCQQALVTFNHTVKSKRLYMSDRAFQALIEFWQAAVDVLRGQGTLDNLQAKNSIAEDLIAQDIDVKNFGKLNLIKQ